MKTSHRQMCWECSTLPARLSLLCEVPSLGHQGRATEGRSARGMHSLKEHIKPFQTQTRRRWGRHARTTDSCLDGGVVISSAIFGD
ncbi:uncharacterized protein ARMOST_21142 [Armillaria ostoyae]|uniref:Uncharacterized protein n=1 Tax=Armillaria ostoyae TaxID=47428 RepID=A0A284S9A7_ARMOS|nr:uncharacterized protein ARMOST_21142 [Armillaria ostoyae]